MNNLQLNVNLMGADKVSRPLRNATNGAKLLAQQLTDTRNKLNQLNNTQKNVDGFIQLKKQFSDAQNKAKSLALELKSAQRPTKSLQNAFNAATIEVKKLKEKLTPLRQELQKSGISTKNLAQHQINLKNNILATNHSINQQSERLRQLNQRQSKLNQIRTKYDNGMQRAAVLGAVGYGSLSTGRTVFRGLKNLLHVGYEFDASMSATQAVTRIDNKNDPRMLALRQQARQLPLISKFTDSEVAQGQYFLGRTGYNPDQILKAMPGMLNLSAAGDVDLGTTADIASNIQMAMGLPAEKMDHVADVLTAMFTRNNVDIPMLGESLKYSAGVGASFGQSLETISTLTAVMGNAGIQGSQAGTTLRQILVRLGTSNAVAKLGVKVADKNGNMRDVIDIMSEIAEATKHMGNVQRASINKQIAGQIGLTGFEVLLTQASTGFLKKMRGEQGEYDGEAARVAKTKLDNLAGDMTMLHAAFENISVELFENNNEWLRDAVRGLTHVLHKIGEFLKKHPALSKAIVMLGTGIAIVSAAFGAFALVLMTVFGPMLMTRFLLSRLGLEFGGLFIKTKVVRGGFKSLIKTMLSFVGAPFKRTSSAIQSLGRSLAKTSKAPKKFGGAFKGVGNTLLNFTRSPIKSLKKGISGIGKTLITVARSPVKSFASLGRGFLLFAGSPIRSFGSAFLGLGRTLFSFSRIPGIISVAFRGLFIVLGPIGWILGAIAAVGLTIYKYWQPLEAFFSGFWEGLKEALKPVREEFSFLDPIVKAVGDTFKWFGKKIDELTKWFKGLFTPVKSTKKELKEAKNAGKSFGRTVGGAVRWVLLKFKSLFLKIKEIIDYIAGTPERIGKTIKELKEALLGEDGIVAEWKKKGQSIADNLKDGISDKWSQTKNAVSGFGASVGNWFAAALNASPTAKLGLFTVDGYTSGVKRRQPTALKAVNKLGNNVSSKFKKSLDIHSPSRVFAKFGGYTVDGYVRGIENKQSTALQFIHQLGNGISNQFKKSLDIHSPSRVFAKFGDHTVDGYIKGVNRTQPAATKVISKLANKITSIPSGVVIDKRVPLSQSSNASQYYITINASPGMNEQDIARFVIKELDRRDRNNSAQFRNSLRDID
ncbi:phage tail tape measure protein [Gilliamella sp. N-G2]|uniref:phage tail tape measure protein n=1 Tax=Gilliamella sp. N-G2 TaxID=1970471 RepID=UPI000A346D9E|nr:phage tail tape measure protein [Gilliamella sp. N-G2]OTQ74779.1 phage tail tape measure protein [Gilliamella sp. N-G2]